jgi:hypothetical protein
MDQRRDVITIALLAACVVMGSIDLSWPCCINTASPRERLATAAAVFEGYVVNLELDTDWIPPSEGAADRCTGRLVRSRIGANLCLSSMMVITVEVTRVWKGVDGRRVRVKADATGGKYHNPQPQIGDLYLVYAFREGEGADLRIDGCTPPETGRARVATLKALGPPERDMLEELGEIQGQSR